MKVRSLCPAAPQERVSATGFSSPKVGDATQPAIQNCFTAPGSAAQARSAGADKVAGAPSAPSDPPPSDAPGDVQSGLTADLSSESGRAAFMRAFSGLLKPASLAKMGPKAWNAAMQTAATALRGLPNNPSSRAAVVPAMLAFAGALKAQPKLQSAISPATAQAFGGLARWLGATPLSTLASRHGGELGPLDGQTSMSTNLQALGIVATAPPARATAPVSKPAPASAGAGLDIIGLATRGVAREDAKLRMLSIDLQSGQLSQAELMSVQHQIQTISAHKELLRSIVRTQQESLQRLIRS